MIRVTLEMVSARGADRDRLLGVAYFANSGELAKGIAGYDIWLSKTMPGRTEEKWKTGRAAVAQDLALLESPPDGSVEAFDNVNRGAWDLLYVLLKAVVGRRNQ